MWPIEQIYKLRSDLITLSLIVDKNNKEIQKNLQIKFENRLNELHQNEIEEPLRFQKLSSFSNSASSSYISSSNFNNPSSPFLVSSSTSVIYPSPSLSSALLRKPKQEIHFDNISHTRLCSPSSSMMQNRLSSSSSRSELSRSRPQSTHLRRSQSTTLSRTSMTPETIWDNVDLFMKPIDKLSSIQAYLVPTEIKEDTDKILNEPIGPHYSTTIGRSQAVLSDPIKSRLIIPPPPSNLSGNPVTSSYLHSRLISAIVPLLSTKKTDKKIDSQNETEIEKNTNDEKNNFECESHHNTTDNDDNDSNLSMADTDFQLDFDQSFTSSGNINKYGNQQNMSIINDLKAAEYNSPITTECTGFTGYGWLSFDDRLEMELAYVGIEGTGNVVTTADCPITQDLKEALKERNEVAMEANRWKKVIGDIIQKKKSKIEKRSERIKVWKEAMDNFHAQERAKTQQGKKKAKQNSNSTESD